jgi:hypothetical protein
MHINSDASTSLPLNCILWGFKGPFCHTLPPPMKAEQVLIALLLSSAHASEPMTTVVQCSLHLAKGHSGSAV